MTRLLRLPILAATWRFVFKPAARYPADPRAVFILVLSVFSGLLALIVDAAPATLESLLPRWGVIIWGVLLAAGSALTLLGMLFQNVNGIVTEQVGSVMVGATTVFYSSLAIWILHVSAIQTVGIVLAWGLSCFVRWIQLQALINSSTRRGEAIEKAAAIEAGVAERIRKYIREQ